MTVRPEPLNRWHEVFDARDPALRDDLRAENCVFRSPAVHTPQEGKALTTAYLGAAMVVLGPTLSYQDEWWDDGSAVLEFTAELDGLTLHGIDMLRWGTDGAPDRVHRDGPTIQGADAAGDPDACNWRSTPADCPGTSYELVTMATISNDVPTDVIRTGCSDDRYV